MADRIKGITVEIGGDTTGLSKALGGVNKNIRDTQSELKDVERLLKFDPTNKELLAQKQRLLGSAIDDTKNKLETLKRASTQAAGNIKNYDEWKAKFDPIQEEINQTERSLDNLNKKQEVIGKSKGIDSSEYKKLQDEVKATKEQLKDLKKQANDVNEEFGHPLSGKQYDALQREIISTEQSLKNLEKQAEKNNIALNKINATADKVANTSGKIAKTTAPATAAVIGMGAAAFNAASDMEESLNKTEVAFEDSADKVKAFAETSLETYGIAKGTALDMAALYGDMATSMDIPRDAAADMSISLTGLAGDLASFKNIGVEQAMTALNGVFTGETESLKTLGIVMTQTNLDAFALEQGIGKTTSQMTEAEKVQLRYAYVMEKTKNAQGDFARTSEGAANSTRVMKESVKEAAATFGENLIPIITPLIQNVTQLVQWFGNLDTAQQKSIITILALVAAISPVAGIISSIATIVPVVTTAFTMLNAVLAANPIGILCIAFIALIALLQQLWEHSESFRNFWIGIWEDITLQFDEAVEWFGNGVNSIGEFFTGLWQGILSGGISCLNNLINKVNGMIAMAIQPLNLLIEAANLIPGVNIPKLTFAIPNIPMLADGGIVLRGSAIVGEAGPELLTVSPRGTIVTPLSSGTSGVKSVGKTQTVNFYITGYSADEGEQIADIVNRELGRIY